MHSVKYDYNIVLNAPPPPLHNQEGSIVRNTLHPKRALTENRVALRAVYAVRFLGEAVVCPIVVCQYKAFDTLLQNSVSFNSHTLL